MIKDNYEACCKQFWIKVQNKAQVRKVHLPLAVCQLETIKLVRYLCDVLWLLWCCFLTVICPPMWKSHTLLSYKLFCCQD